MDEIYKQKKEREKKTQYLTNFGIENSYCKYNTYTHTN